MATTQLFKNTSRNIHRKRYMSTEDNFSKGMQFTNAPLATGYAKAIVNFDLKNDGDSLVPRGGLQLYGGYSVEQMSLGVDTDYYIHHADAAYVSNYNDTDAYLCNYFLLGANTYGAAGIDIASAKLVIEHKGSYITCTHDNTPQDSLTGTMLNKPPITYMQDFVNLANPSRDGIHASLEGNTYVLVKDSNNVHKLGRLIIKFTTQYENAANWYIEEVTAYEVQPTQAMNYGYNMLKANPYTFSNTVSATGAVQLTGVLPYDESGKLLLTARPGTPMVFKLYYKYPQADVDGGDKYLVQWEVQDLNGTSDAEVIRKVRGSTEYTPGSDITLAYTPTYTTFSIIVRLYKKSEITTQDAAWDNDPVLQNLVTKDDNLTPNQVTTLASYYLTSNSDTSMLNMDAVAYKIPTATGMCSWQQRLVFWGVNGAKTTLFVSEINNPAYVPYPNNCEIFKDDIICAVPYMTSLLVFTKTALYKLTINDDGLTYKSECVQERLNMTPSDANTVITIQNMVYFKSGNYFYMVVPNNQLTSQTGVQIAPVSRMIEQMLDNLNITFSRILNELYNFTFDGYHVPIELSFLDYYVYIANSQIRNVYKVSVGSHEGAAQYETYYFDISLNYDTVLRAWTMYVYETSTLRDVVYKATVTGENIMVHPFISNDKVMVQLLMADPHNPKDTHDTGNVHAREFGNWQLLITGNRTFSEDLKKRFREVQFCVNITAPLLDNTLKFNTAFVVDDVETVPMYKSVVSQITDPLDPNYGDIFIERELLNEISTPELTVFNDWELDTAAFPDITMYKIRYKVSGKGYGGSVKILSKNEIPYELLHINWVYRIMFAR